MNPLIVFDYMFYRIAYFYEHRFMHGVSKELSAMAILTLFELLNILSVLNYFELDSKFSGNGNVLFSIILYVILSVLNYLRYFKITNYNKLEKKWRDESSIVRHIKSFFIWLYFVLSFILFTNI